MSSEATKKFLKDILGTFSETTSGTRTSHQNRAQHSLLLDRKSLEELVDRASSLYNIDKDTSNSLLDGLYKELSSLNNNGELTFKEILAARANIGLLGTATSKKGGAYSTYFLKDKDGNAYVDSNGAKIELHNILQLGHDESITTVQAKAALNRLIRYKTRYVSTNKAVAQESDMKLIDAFINIFNKAITLLEKTDELNPLDDVFPKDVLGKNTGVTANILEQWKKGNDIEINLTSTPEITLRKKLLPSGVRFEIAVDNNVKGSISSGIKSGVIKGAGILLYHSLTDSNKKKLAFKDLKNPSYSGVVTSLFANKDWLNLKGSPSYKDHIKGQLIEAITGKKQSSLSIKEGTSKVGASKSAKTKVIIPKASTVKQPKLLVPKPKLSPLRTLEGKFTSATSLMTLMNQMLHETIKKNMQRPNLHYQTGRFAKSVKVEGITRARDGALTAFLSYMRYPYATFEAGGKQGHKGYYPSRLINESAREIATKLTRERFMSVTIK